MKKEIIDKVSLFLLNEGFLLKSFKLSFDIIARKKNKTLLIKVFEDANAINVQMMKQMGLIASYLNAVPIILARKAGFELENNVVYYRKNIVTINFKTFQNSIKSKFPFLKATCAGITAKLNGGKLKQIREQEGFSLNVLANKIGVTKKTIIKYENSESEILVNNAIKLYNIFGDRIFNSRNIFKSKNDLENTIPSSGISKKYCSLGFNVLETTKTPFDIVARRNNDLILTSVGDNINKNFCYLIDLLDVNNLQIYKKYKPKYDLPSIAEEEFLEFEKPKEIFKFIQEF